MGLKDMVGGDDDEDSNSSSSSSSPKPAHREYSGDFNYSELYSRLQNPTWGSGDFLQFGKDEFEMILEFSGYEWERVDNDISGQSGTRFSREIVYDSPDLGFPVLPNVVARIFSTIDKRTGKSREKGNDSVKLVAWDKNINRPVGGRSYSKRLGTLPENLLPKIKSLIEEYDQYLHPCEECGAWMVERENSSSGNKFLGCVRYPDCTNTAPIPD